MALLAGAPLLGARRPGVAGRRAVLICREKKRGLISSRAQNLSLDGTCWACIAVSAIPQQPLSRDQVPVITLAAVLVHTWSPLGGGVLAGRYRPGQPPGADTRIGRLGASPMPAARSWAEGMLSDRNLYVAAETAAIAADLGTSPASVALAWVARQPGVTAVIAGPAPSASYTTTSKDSTSRSLPTRSQGSAKSPGPPAQNPSPAWVHTTDRHPEPIPVAAVTDAPGSVGWPTRPVRGTYWPTRGGYEE